MQKLSLLSLKIFRHIKLNPFSILKSQNFQSLLFSSVGGGKSNGPPNQRSLINEGIVERFPKAIFIDQSGKSQGEFLSMNLLKNRPKEHDLIILDSSKEVPIVRYQAKSVSFRLALQRAEVEKKSRLSNRQKEIHLTTAVESHDFDIKMLKVEEWILKGWRVKIAVEERRRKVLFRANSNLNVAFLRDPKKEIMDRVMRRIGGIADMCVAPELEGKTLILSVYGNAKTLAHVKQERRGK